ncbi:MAG: hypothetical protein SFW67_14635 [Myxococcaceae bacterium]|nr:hypothetical protein [Myxococcaceae bacterium]
MEWLDDVPKWRQGDAAAAERLREYVTPFVHGALVARLPHHVANQKTPETLDQVLSTPGLLKQDAQLVQHAVSIARRLAARTRVASHQERPNPDSTRNEGRQWLERVRTLPEDVRERVVWRLVWGVPGPELCEVLGLEPAQLKAELERGVGDSMTPRQSLAGAEYLWDLSGEPSTALARTETFAMSLRFDPLEPPESAEAAFTAATFQDLTDAVVTETNVRPEANPFGDFQPTRVAIENKLPPEPRSAGRMQPNAFPADEKTQGAFDLPAAARGLVPRADPQPSPKSASRAGLPPSPERKREPPARTTKLFDDDRPSKKRVATEGRKETMEAPAVPAPSQTRVDDDDRPSRSKLQVRGRVDAETSGRKKNPEVEARRVSKPIDTAPDAPAVAKSEVTPIGAPSEPSLEPTDPESAPKGRMPVVTERLTPQPVTPATRYVLIGVVGMSLFLAILWRLGVFR